MLLASHLPKGKAFEQAFDAQDNFGKLIMALAKSYKRRLEALERLSKEFDVLQTKEMIEDWENSVGIHGEVCTKSGSLALEERRQQVFLVLTTSNRRGLRMINDALRLFKAMGFTIEGVSEGGVFSFAYGNKKRPQTKKRWLSNYY